MIDVNSFIKFLKKNKINFFTGVPDSVLKNLSIKIDNFSKNKHIISTNEGSAVALGAGYYLSTKKLPLIYMQNSGLGNALNPLISLYLFGAISSGEEINEGHELKFQF